MVARNLCNLLTTMFNFWIFFFVALTAVSLIFMVNTLTPHLIFIISEFNWVCFIVCGILMAQLSNDPRFFILVYFFLFIAAVEVVIYVLYIVLKKNQQFNKN